jgi:hypothetical protein
MEKQSNIKSLVLVISISFGIEMDATNNRINDKNVKARQAKVATAHLLKLSYIVMGIRHIVEAGRKTVVHLNDNKSTATQFLAQVLRGALTDLGGAYGSFYSSYALSNYTKKLRDNKKSSEELTDVSSELDEEIEDIDTTLAQIALHSWAIISSGILAYRDAKIYQHAFRMKFDKDYVGPNTKEVARGAILNEREKWGMLGSSIKVPSRIFTAYTSWKTIFSKLKNLVPNKKKELPKII